MYHILRPSRRPNTVNGKGKMNLSYIETVETLQEAREKIRDTCNIIYAPRTGAMTKEK